jgi:DNA repair exonuclease SbcCD ATPase subunit
MANNGNLKIVSLKIENVKRIVAAHIEPDGSVCILGGKNGAGKTSALDAISYALGGRKLIHKKPLREGAKHGHVSVDLGDVTVTRTFTDGGGGTLKIEAKDGMRPASPQAWLDARIGNLSFDPLEFSRLKPDKQAKTLRDLVGLDFTELDVKRARLYDERRDINRDVQRLKSQLDGATFHEDAPEEEVSVSALMEELREADATVSNSERADDDVERLQREEHRLEMQIDELRARLKDSEKAKAGLISAVDGARKTLAAANKAIIDPRPIRDRIASADEVNQKVRENLLRQRLTDQHRKAADNSDAMTAKLEAIDQAKAGMLATAKFPIDDLSFDEDGVTLNGIPFDQASSAEQLRTSVAMGLAMNPTIRVLLVRDASLLDEDGLRVIAELAEENDAQVWLERVGDGPECSVVIADGHVVESRDAD